jgi:hypothetical protein
MSEVKSTYEIKFPIETTYFIAYTNTDVFAYGIVTPDQEMVTGQPILWTTLSEAEWLYKLEHDFKVIPEPEI